LLLDVRFEHKSITAALPEEKSLENKPKCSLGSSNDVPNGSFCLHSKHSQSLPSYSLEVGRLIKTVSAAVFTPVTPEEAPASENSSTPPPLPHPETPSPPPILTFPITHSSPQSNPNSIQRLPSIIKQAVIIAPNGTQTRRSNSTYCHPKTIYTPTPHQGPNQASQKADARDSQA